MALALLVPDCPKRASRSKKSRGATLPRQIFMILSRKPTTIN
jgi:hypothetical protein